MPIVKQTFDPAEDKPDDAELQRMLDEALEMTFPASDPVALGALHRRPQKDAPDRGDAVAKPRRRPAGT